LLDRNPQALTGKQDLELLINSDEIRPDCLRIHPVVHFWNLESSNSLQTLDMVSKVTLQ